MKESMMHLKKEKIHRNLDELKGFSKTMSEEGIVSDVKILDRYIRKAGNLYGEMFGIDPKEYLFYVKRLCYADKEPVSIEEVWILQKLVPKISGIDLNVFSIYETYEMFGIHLKKAALTLDLVTPGEADAKHLGITNREKVLLFQSLSYDERGRVIEFNKNYVRGDRCNFQVHFNSEEEL